MWARAAKQGVQSNMVEARSEDHGLEAEEEALRAQQLRAGGHAEPVVGRALEEARVVGIVDHRKGVGVLDEDRSMSPGGAVLGYSTATKHPRVLHELRKRTPRHL